MSRPSGTCQVLGKQMAICIPPYRKADIPLEYRKHTAPIPEPLNFDRRTRSPVKRFRAPHAPSPNCEAKVAVQPRTSRSPPNPLVLTYRALTFLRRVRHPYLPVYVLVVLGSHSRLSAASNVILLTYVVMHNEYLTLCYRNMTCLISWKGLQLLCPHRPLS